LKEKAPLFAALQPTGDWGLVMHAEERDRRDHRSIILYFYGRD